LGAAQPRAGASRTRVSSVETGLTVILAGMELAFGVEVSVAMGATTQH
jgi:hypothetical protein